MKFHILIYWCQFNYADSARIKKILEFIWFQYTKDIKEANIVIFDTCSVRQKSEDKIWWKLIEIPKDKKIWITGCMVGRNLDKKRVEKILKEKNISLPNHRLTKFTRWNFESLNDIKIKILLKNEVFWELWQKLKQKFENIELIFRTDEIDILPLILYELNDLYKQIINKNKLELYIDSLDSSTSWYLSILPDFTANQNFDENVKTAYVPIQIGCNQFCSYCIVPFTRGLEKNRPMDEVISEVKYHLDHWKKEIVLLWQIVNKHPDFYKILKEILKLPWLKRLRYTSPYPTKYTDDILSLHENEEKLVPHIHAPVQSGSDKILKKMFRGYTIKDYITFVDKIKSLKRDISLTTDIIVGFPWETDKDFEATLKLTEYARFDMIYIWIYSPRPWTHAAKNYKDNIPQQVKKQRWKTLNDLLQKISLENNKAEIGKIKEIMVTKVYDDGSILWYDEKLKNVIWFKWKYTNLKLWDFINVKITNAQPLKLLWEIKV